ncbi:riboflavin biosynthesis protein RibF [Pediococcus ethanolidurans]|uniref:riboflavin biosynthesis protein RibF n=1 Tax=Pediococcus ethanolidurans TaxID=319653 RepID=UPI001C1F1176|nr:riboflavin biosynthesis protein RibF [Pediococcus ethanolidurans]MBU7555069.1 riboflavin biosynthesis protein RibF [Pediococcus ethanolidurans]MBU7563277.1 riboflavin biosynthesis protein RibF [Pediococcus ethanolidurans]MCT4397688.1 riboflavin biosynthesis protein RibF [Pediococcus ethanolidurans]MCV3314709.1 riboflavin biosynthesis protein RibF [Pediococcus ethanolidurans]MCV3321688.1 riboflavin biosynthesis protein RibF [Pediococcus ethanolidurans]
MRIIYLHHPYKTQQIPQTEVVLAMGFFGGVHLGHQAVIKKARAEATKRKMPLAAMTFDHHPSVVFPKPGLNGLHYLSSVKRKAELMEDFGVDILYVVSFTSSLAHLKPQEFVDQYMVALHAKVIVAGFDYTYGPREIADMAHLPSYSKNHFDIITVNEFLLDGQKVSSTRIRNDLEKSNVDHANKFLGYVYQTSGLVVHGEARGRTLGFPTANVLSDPWVRIPGIGIYAVQLKVGTKWWPAMASVGRNVTFGENRPITLEINIFDFDQEIYGEQVSVKWYHYVRGEIKFANAAELVEQLKMDEKNIRKYFANLNKKRN